MWISIVSSAIAFIMFGICEILFYIKKDERKDNGRWFVGRTHKGNDDRIIYAYYPRERNGWYKGYQKAKQGIYTEDIKHFDTNKDKWIL